MLTRLLKGGDVTNAEKRGLKVSEYQPTMQLQPAIKAALTAATATGKTPAQIQIDVNKKNIELIKAVMHGSMDPKVIKRAKGTIINLEQQIDFIASGSQLGIETLKAEMKTALSDYMALNDFDKKTLAEYLGVGKDKVSKLSRGDVSQISISSIIEVFNGIGFDIKLIKRQDKETGLRAKYLAKMAS